MKTAISPVLAILVTCLLFSSNASAQEKLEDFKAGKTITGDEVDFDKLKGRVIAIEYWGPR